MRALTQQLDHATQDCRVDWIIRRWKPIEGRRPPGNPVEGMVCPWTFIHCCHFLNALT